MPSSIVVDDDEQIIADLLRQHRRRRAGGISQAPIWLPGPDHDPDIFTISGPSDDTHTLTYLPLGLNKVVLNGTDLVWADDFTIDWDTGTITLLPTLTVGAELVVWYVTTGEKIAASLPEDLGIGPSAFIGGAGNGGSSTTASATVHASRAAGDLLLATVALFSISSAPAAPTGWTLLGNDSTIAVYWKISDGTETTFSLPLGGTMGWACACQVWRGGNITVQGSAFGPSASTSTTCDTPTTSVSGEPTAVHVWGACKTFSGSVSITPPGSTTNSTTGATGGRAIAMASEDLSGVTTTTARQASASATVNDGWGAAVILLAADA